MSYDHDAGRADLIAFAAQQPTNFWKTDTHLQRLVGRWTTQEQLAQWREEFESFGAEAAGPIDEMVRINDRVGNHPRLERWGPYGDRIEAVEHHPTYHAIGRLIYGSGVMSALGEPGRTLRSQTLGFISGLNGEAGHNCPLACTAGIIKALLALGTDELKERYLPRLLSRDYDTLAHGAQFLTEVQGGSDVGANSIVARRVADTADQWTIHGEKWFCSNVTADLILLTARPEDAGEGTKGLGLFLMPRRLPDGSLNAFRIRRLKDKLGTRTMPSAEIDFEGARSWALGPIEDGFKNVMTHVIDTSRIFNAVGTSANARRAHFVAHGYAQRRKAFGPAIIEYPMVQETLADMRAETLAMMSGSFYLLHLDDCIELHQASDEDQEFHRMAVNLNKIRSAQSAHEVVLSAIETLGGNGAIESFSVLPRLLRDNVVYENWEGTHNVLLAQVLRDCHKLHLERGLFAHLERQCEGHERLLEAVGEARAAMTEVLAVDPAAASLRIRPLGARLAWIQWAAAMHADGTPGQIIDHFLDRRLGPTAIRDASYLARIKSISNEI